VPLGFDKPVALQAKPFATIAALTKVTGLTTPTVTSGLRELSNRGIVRETTGRARDRIFVYSRYMDVMAQDR
jgi:Fic family protein